MENNKCIYTNVWNHQPDEYAWIWIWHIWLIWRYTHAQRNKSSRCSGVQLLKFQHTKPAASADTLISHEQQINNVKSIENQQQVATILHQEVFEVNIKSATLQTKKTSLQNWWKDVKRCEKMWKDVKRCEKKLSGHSGTQIFETLFQSSLKLLVLRCFVGVHVQFFTDCEKICACQLNISSPTGPAEQFAGGSLPKSLGFRSVFWAQELPEEKGLKMTWPFNISGDRQERVSKYKKGQI